jgi:hypothetical protein
VLNSGRSKGLVSSGLTLVISQDCASIAWGSIAIVAIVEVSFREMAWKYAERRLFSGLDEQLCSEKRATIAIATVRMNRPFLLILPPYK